MKSYLLRIRPLFKYVFFLALSFLFVLVNSEASSSWKEVYPLDSTIFMLIGHEILQGKILYKEIFDHKGPMLFVLEAISQFFGDYRKGVFYLEITTLFVSTVFLYKTAYLLTNNKLLSYSSVLSFFLILRYLYDGGNTNEMYSFPSFFISFFMFINIGTKKDFLLFFMLGLMFSAIFWIRPNNALPLLSFPCFLFFDFILNKNYIKLRQFLLGYILGQIPLLLIFSIYFFYNDAFFDFIHATFLVNVSYVGSYFELSPYFMQYNFLLFLLFIGSIIICLVEKKYNQIVFVISLFVLTLLTANIKDRYNLHYFIVFVFSYIVYLLFMFIGVSSLKKSKCLSVLIFVFLCLFFTRNMYYQISGTWATKEYYESKANIVRYNLSNILEVIPKGDIKELYPYNMLPDIFLLSDIPISYKYFTLQDSHAQLSSNIYLDLINLFTSKTTSPKWLLTMKKDQEMSSILELDSIMKTNYVLHSTDGYYFLYKKKKIE